MERIAAIKVLGKMLGKQMGYRVDPKAPTPDERAAARERLPGLLAAKEAAREARVKKRDELLADPHYRELVAAFEAADKAASEAFSISRHFKITVGVSNSMFFQVKAQGDSWEDVIAKLKKPRG